MELITCLFEGISDVLLTEYMNRDLLPNFKRLCNKGSYGQLQCNPIPYEASGIVTAFSGIDVSTHGIISYWKPVNENYIPEQWNSRDIKDYMFWNKEPYKDLRYCIVNLFGTQPTYDINGYLLSYSMENNLRFAYPNSLILELNKQKLPYVQDTTVFFTKNTDKSLFYKDILEVDMLRKKVFFELIKRDIDMAIVNFTQIDRFSHFYFDKKDTGDVKDTILYQAYKRSDEFLGELMDTAEKMQSELLVFSEVGFGDLKKFVSINDYLCKNKLLCQNKDQQILYEQSIAFESVQGTHGININLKGKYRNGTVSNEEYSSTLQHIINVLKQMPNPYTNNPMFSNVFPGRGYSIAKNIPDILLEPYDWEYLPYGDPYWANHVSRHYQTGWHRNTSFWGYYGNRTQKSGQKNLIDLYSIMQQTLF